VKDFFRSLTLYYYNDTLYQNNIKDEREQTEEKGSFSPKFALNGGQKCGIICAEA